MKLLIRAAGRHTPPQHRLYCARRMASTGQAKPYLSHEERTSAASRRTDLHPVTLSSIDQYNSSIRLLRLRPERQQDGVEFSPGQWLDVHVPGLPKAGGFTITSTPAEAKVSAAEDGSTVDAALELAVQYSPKNPPAAWLWRPREEILGQTLHVRVGGDFIWPPPGIQAQNRQRVVLVAGGVGINPLISILTHLQTTRAALQSLKLLYATKFTSADASDVLFLPRIRKLLADVDTKFNEMSVDIYTSRGDQNSEITVDVPPQQGLAHYNRRIATEDLERAVGPDKEQRARTVCYICGPQAMTDSFVETVRGFDGVHDENVLCEKWW